MGVGSGHVGVVEVEVVAEGDADDDVIQDKPHIVMETKGGLREGRGVKRGEREGKKGLKVVKVT